jgi:integrase
MARKILARIRRVIDWVTIRGYRNVMAGTITVPLPNPCAGVLSALPRQPAEGNHAALPYPALPEFVAAIPAWNTDLAVRLAVEFTILTAARTSETLLAKWSEIDIETRIWNVPAARMKMDRDHLVPLSQRAVAILKTAKDLNSEYVFPSPLDLKKPMSNVAMLRALQRAGYRDLTMHGFRATFRTWAAERTRADHLVIEACLAHKVQGIERHYLRTTFIERRRKLMDTWAAFATAAPAGKVVRIG